MGKKSLKYRSIVPISTLEGKIKFDAGSVLFVDSRTEMEYGYGHIKGAVHIPAIPESISLKNIKEHFNRIKSRVELVIYCDGETCGSSDILARRLVDMGYSRNIYVLKKGFPDWREAGYPVTGEGD